MKQNNVEVFLGHELSDPTEQKFLRRLREDLEREGVPALILANLEVSPRHRQLDFVIATAVRTVQCELKGYHLPVIGSANGHWELILPSGEHRPLDSNAGRQAKEGTFALSDELKAFARKASVPAPQRNRFYRGIDTVVCIFPEIPEGSEIDAHSHVAVKGYESLLASLTSKGPRLPWNDEHWRALIRRLHLYRLEEQPELARRERQHQQLAEDYCRRFLSSHRAGPPTQVNGNRSHAAQITLSVPSLEAPPATILPRIEEPPPDTSGVKPQASSKPVLRVTATRHGHTLVVRISGPASATATIACTWHRYGKSIPLLRRHTRLRQGKLETAFRLPRGVLNQHRRFQLRVQVAGYAPVIKTLIG